MCALPARPQRGASGPSAQAQKSAGILITSFASTPPPIPSPPRSSIQSAVAMLTPGPCMSWTISSKIPYAPV